MFQTGISMELSASRFPLHQWKPTADKDLDYGMILSKSTSVIHLPENIDGKYFNGTFHSTFFLIKIYWEYFIRSFDWSMGFRDIKFSTILVKSQNRDANNLEMTSMIHSPMLLLFRPFVLL